MRERFTRAFYAVSTAAITIGVGLAAGPMASAATVAKGAATTIGPTIGTLNQGGYQMSGRQFRWISSQIQVPDAPSSRHFQTCPITAAPHFTATITAVPGPITGPLVLTDGATTLVNFTDYTVAPPPGNPAAPGVYVVTLIDSGNWKAGDTLTASVAGGTVVLSLPFGGTDPTTTTFVASSPVATCTVTLHNLFGSITVYDASNHLVLYTPADYNFVSGTMVINLIASGRWDFGDTLNVFSDVFPSAFIQLSNGSLPNFNPGHSAGGQYVRAGVEPCVMAAQIAGPFPGFTCPNANSWVAFFESFRNSITWFPFFSHVVVLPNSISQGDGVGFSLYDNVAGNELFAGIDLPNGTSYDFQSSAHGGIFQYAAALVDFTDSNGMPAPLNPFGHHFIINEFLRGAVTTVSGNKGSFVGPWTTSPVQATSNGLPWPAGTPRVVVSPLFSDGLVANGAIRPSDAFDVIASR